MQFLNNEKGMAMPLTIMIMLVFMLLGTAIWQYSVNDLKHVMLDESRMRAHYVARAGADAALEAWLSSDVSERPQGKAERVYYNEETGLFVNSDPGEHSGGYFEVIVTDEVSGKTIIESTGYYELSSQVVTIEIIPPLLGHDLGWYDYNSGQFNYGNFEHDKPVVLQAKQTGQTLQFLKAPQGNNSVSLKSPMLFFESSLGSQGGGTFHGTINLYSQTIVFFNALSLHNQHGEMILHGYDYGNLQVGLKNTELEIKDDPVAGSVLHDLLADDDLRWGEVYFNDVRIGNSSINSVYKKAFYYPILENGVSIRNLESHGLLLEIDSPVTPTYVENAGIIWR